MTTKQKLLILTKTYPAPSSKYREVTCVAAVNSEGQLRRLFPVPFRFLEGSQQFSKWQWIEANTRKPNSDLRPESFRIDAMQIQRLERMGTENGWGNRLLWLEPHVYPSFAALDDARKSSGVTLGIVKPEELLNLEISSVSEPEWTPEDRAKLAAEDLFDDPTAKNRPPLRKLPYDFHYHYRSGRQTLRHKITDWEVGALFWNCYRRDRLGWQEKVEEKLRFSGRDLMFLLGTIHRFPDQWLIVGLIYPPKPQAAQAVAQLDLI